MLRLRHCTLVPGLALTRAGEPVAPNQPSLVIELRRYHGGDRPVHRRRDCARGRGVTVKITNSIVDATAFRPGCICRCR